MKIDIAAATVTLPLSQFFGLLRAAGVEGTPEKFGWTKEVIAEVTRPQRVDADGNEKGTNTPVARVAKFAIGDRVIADTDDGLFPGKVTAVTKRTYDVLCDNGDEYEMAAEHVYAPEQAEEAATKAKEAAAATAAAEYEKAYERARITVALLTPGVKAADLSDFGGKRFAIMASVVGLNPFKDLKGVEGADRYKAIVKAAKAKQGEKGSAQLLKAAKATVAAYESAQTKETETKKAAAPVEKDFSPAKGQIQIGDWVRISKSGEKAKVEAIKVKGSSLKVFVKSKDAAHTVVAGLSAFQVDGKVKGGATIWNPRTATIATA